MMATERRSRRRRVDEFLTLLPDDLLKKILLLLPVENLVCLASTCKKWRDDYLLDDDFARLHLDRWRSRYAILYTSVSQYTNLIYSPIFDGSVNEIILERLEDCFSKILKKSDRDYVCGLDSCDGLLLIAYDYVRLVVCNPLMRSFKFLHPPPETPAWTCHWNIVYDASIKRYKIIGIIRAKIATSIKNGVIISLGHRVYILELSKSSSESSKWKDVCVCDDELWDGDFGGKVQKSVLVDEKGKNKKLYYLTYNDNRSPGKEVRTSLIYIDIETHQIKAVEAVACSSMSLLGKYVWVGSSSTGRFYMSDFVNVREEFNLFVLEDLHNPIWKRQCIIRRNVVDLGMDIRPFAVVQDNGNDEEEKILYLINGKIHEYQIGRGLWREAYNNTGHSITHSHIYYRDYYSVAHRHSLIRI